MEIKQILFGSRRRIGLLVLVVVVAMVVSGAIVFLSPRDYRANATFTAPSENKGSPAAIQQAVENLRANLTADHVTSAAAEAGGITAAAVTDGLALSQRGQSDTVELSFTTSDAGIAQEVVTAASVALIEQATSTDYQSAQDQLERYQEDVQKLQGQADAYVAQNGQQAPDDEVRALQTELTSLRVALTNARIDGSPRTAGLEARIREINDALTRLGPKVQEYAALTRSLEQAQRRVDSASDALATAEAVRASVQPTNLDASDARQLPRTSDALRAMVAAGALAALACMLIMVLTHPSVRNRRKGVAPTANAPTAAAPPSPDGAQTALDGHAGVSENGRVGDTVH